ncbi:glycoside hydrolase family 3 protein [Paenibacillus radicis (ex Xue et al. 2023)]|uniref:Glycoside hydrolase family 3 C-terminal domain-containing protein n=1 Tax=Paenibacillus radicis (ex Xue et al. 2023) TaxID=2972489 RepID=A0ABT1YBL1_9BACL|nr:glycoside hydrolase family 3 protein [Paenibacillus radicis (ex Xue et al. 2023)]MCR8630580.1 glycoside hydrolase family 3 C-terminal domain-containing protein [Paenibacillus radicis (ex Xue et al. 2023)]
MENKKLYPFQNADLPLNERVEDLVSRLTLEEKIQLMCQYQADIPRLGINKYKHGTEGAHGVAWLGEATVFPQNIGLSCTWNPDLMHKIGAAIGDEARVYYQKDPALNGLTIWAPTVDMERDPRWGRTEEAYGEDPYLTGRLSTELVKGMQGDDSFYLKTAATLKHFLGNNNEIHRGECSASIDPRNMREYYLKAFEPAFREGGAQSMMSAYNSVNGTPCNLNLDMNRIVKGEWGMDGFVVSDAGDVLGTVDDHRYLASYAEAVARSVKSGIDSITDDQDISLRALRDAIEQGMLAQSDLDRALKNTFRVRIRLGEFDAERNPYASVPESRLCSAEHAEISLQAARESIVLLKNDGALPLQKEKLGKISVLGPLASVAYTDWYSGTPAYRITPLQGIGQKLDSCEVSYHDGADRIRLRSAATGLYVGIDKANNGLLHATGTDASVAETFVRMDWGWGSTTLKALSNDRFVTESDLTLSASALETRGWFVKEAFGMENGADGMVSIKSWDGRLVGIDTEAKLMVCSDEANEARHQFVVEVVEDGIEQAVAAAASSDTAIVFVGNCPFINGKECVDRQDIVLPPDQEKLIREVAKANSNIIVVIIGSYPYALEWASEHVPGIIYSSHAGQELGNAMADVIFGEYNPAGRLSMTWYRSADQLPDLMDYDIIKGNRTYQYFEDEVQYPFGHGLSYTSFSYSDLRINRERIDTAGKLTVSIQIKNTGRTAGDEVVQLYVRSNRSRVKRPIKTLKGFTRIHLKPDQSKIVSFELPAAELAFWDVTREKYCVEDGLYTIMIGSTSTRIEDQVIVKVDGEVVPPRKLNQQPVSAILYDDYDNVVIDECTEGGNCIHNGDGDGWIAFYDVEFGNEASRIEARLANAGKKASIELRLGSKDGQLVGTCVVPSTGGAQAWTTVTASTAAFTGRHDVYLVMKGAMQLKSIRID